MNAVRVEELQGFRAPTPSEADVVARYASAFYQTRIRRCKVISSATAVLGLVFLYGSGGNPVSIVAGLLMFVATFGCIAEKNRLKSNISVFRAGRFQVLDGSVCEIAANADTPGVCNVRFLSQYGERCSRWNTARLENLSVGTPLLMVCVDRKQIKGGICWVFSPFMMTEEGMKHTY